MKMYFKFIATSVMTATFVLSSCSVDDGAEGLMGPQGIQGEQGFQGERGLQGDQGEKGDPGVDGKDGDNGTDGPDGLDGADGKDGADGADGLAGSDGADGADGANGQDGADGQGAEVVASSWITLTANDFLSSQKPDGMGEMYDATYTTPLLTQEALDQDVVLVYLKLNSGQIVLMPYVYHSDDHMAVAYTAFLAQNNLGINMTPSSYIYNNESLEISVRFVIIPATTLTLPDKSLHKDFKKMTYEEVISYFNLQ
ncbi:Collagen triple helix repeat-containing protein [Pricia antarctica]|uniref:Collagen triple helix repeat-containing protein n=1 Tax=Pricia antarctica TaxID=641691 RepID=A0A1G7C6X7_9FLAO|nr:collagen-like protein [Pricia antarctica]SDE35068.1 Collagen triple helix repeat-containing protein [Pricia antarctica]